MPTAKSQLGQLSKAAVRQIAQEPFEVAKTAGKQVAGIESVTSQAPRAQVSQTTQVSESELKNLSEIDKAKSRAMYENFQKEIQAISNQKREDQARAQALENAAVKESQVSSKTLVEPSLRPSRNPLRGMAKKLGDLKKRAEIRMPPSG